VLNYDLSGVSFVLDPSYLKLAWLRPFKKNQLPHLADADAYEITGEVTLENRGEKGQAIITGTYSGSSSINIGNYGNGGQTSSVLGS
jgi:hypothetical protein